MTGFENKVVNLCIDTCRNTFICCLVIKEGYMKEYSRVLMWNTKELMQCHSGTNNRAPRWTFTDPWKPEVRPGAREESASPAWLAAPAMNMKKKIKIRTLGLSNSGRLNPTYAPTFESGGTCPRCPPPFSPSPTPLEHKKLLRLDGENAFKSAPTLTVWFMEKV